MRRTRAPANVTARGASPSQGLRRPVPRRGHRRCAPGPRSRRHAAAARRLAARRAARAMTDAVSIVGSGVVAERLRRIIADRHRLVGADAATRRGAELAVLATAEPHAPRAAELLAAGVHVVSTSGSSTTCARCSTSTTRSRDRRRAGRRRRGVAGPERAARPSPRRQLTSCQELHIAVHGTAGPSCARAHHGALGGWAVGWHDDHWIERPAGSGRELCWFPEPVGARDCYRAAMPDPWLLHRSFPDVDRISARVSATRRDRFTARLPMLSPPHREGGIGALRVEARGHDEPAAQDDADHGHRRADRHRGGGGGRGVRRPPGGRSPSLAGVVTSSDARPPDRSSSWRPPPAAASASSPSPASSPPPSDPTHPSV